MSKTLHSLHRRVGKTKQFTKKDYVKPNKMGSTEQYNMIHTKDKIKGPIN